MGWVIKNLRIQAEKIAGDNKLALRFSGLFITILVTFLSGLIGFLIERTIFFEHIFPRYVGITFLIIGLASTLASRSLRDSVLNVINLVPDNTSADQNLKRAKEKLKEIVGRDVSNLDKNEILRASAETASENAIDGIFAPIFWIFFGSILWRFSYNLPGPLSLALIFKASSTLDSMIGYKEGRLMWLGTAGAKLDDVLTWIPCRLVLITLPLITLPWKQIPKAIKTAFREGSQDNSPNSGISEAIFANCIGIRMGGINRYNNKSIRKPELSTNSPIANKKSIRLLLDSIILLQFLWIVIFGLMINFLN